MKTLALASLRFLFIFYATSSLAGGSSGGPVYPSVEGVMGVIPALENACAAIWIGIPEGQALAGVEWFNNDGTLPFPGLYIESGIPENPVALENTLLAAESVTGESGAWSTIQFNEPVTCASEGLYVIFRFPAGIEATGFGAGGGPALGYVGEFSGAPGWLCSDGASWDRVGGEFGFAVLPILINASAGMAQLNGSQGSIESTQTDVPLITTMHTPFPNPFNPEVEIHFYVAKALDVDLSVYDIRGHLVVNLVHDHFAKGLYHVPWRGMDATGRQMSSGVYFARFKAGSVVENHRLVLVK